MLGLQLIVLTSLSFYIQRVLSNSDYHTYTYNPAQTCRFNYGLPPPADYPVPPNFQRQRGTKGIKRRIHNEQWRNNHISRRKAQVNTRNLRLIETTKLVAGATINCRSLNNKTYELRDICEKHNLDYLSLTETWVKPGTATYGLAANTICPDGYSFHNQHRKGSKRGGGVGIVLKDSLRPKTVSLKTYSTFEHLAVSTTEGLLVTIYRPPSSNKTNFIEELDEFLSSIHLIYNCVTITGDVNIHLNKSDSWSDSFNNTLEAHGLMNHVNSATHTSGNTLDTVICKTDRFKYLTIIDTHIADHFLVLHFLTSSSRKSDSRSSLATSREYSFRDFRNFHDAGSFCESVNINLRSLQDDSDACCSATFLLQTISDAVDQYVPIQVRKSSLKCSRYKQPWSADIAHAKTLKRKWERMLTKSHLTIHRDLVRAQVLKIRSLVKAERASKIKSKIDQCRTSREVFTFYGHSTKTTMGILPVHDNSHQLALGFGSFFIDKVAKITATFSKQHSDLASSTIPAHVTAPDTKLTSFTILSTEEVMKLRKLKTSLSVDQMPKELFQQLWVSISEFFTTLVNQSLASGLVPSAFKIATLTPILKASNLDTNSFPSYRPVSNLPFLAKVLESAVASQLSKHLQPLLSPYQSAFRVGHSVESALTDVSSDIFKLLDQGNNIFMILLDLSAAFDTIDHALLIDILHSRFNVDGIALRWLASYLEDRSFRVQIAGSLSEPFPLKVGVPQGSILGPILFNCVMTKLADILTQHNVRFHIYADDTQIWFPFSCMSEENTVRANITSIFAIIENFMLSHHLKLNPSKTVFLPISRKCSSFSALSLTSDCQIPPSPSARNLGIIFDAQMTFNSYINELRRSCFHHIRNIQTLKPFIPSDHLVSLVLAVVVSRLDFCNSVLSALNTTQIKRIQSIQNACARLVTGTNIRHSITPCLRSLHWLPIKFRITYKLAVIGHKVVHDALTPLYLREALVIKSHQRFTRSSLGITFHPHNFKLVSVGAKSPYHNIGKVWNQLPVELRGITTSKTFKTRLKTHFFNLAYL